MTLSISDQRNIEEMRQELSVTNMLLKQVVSELSQIKYELVNARQERDRGVAYTIPGDPK